MLSSEDLEKILLSVSNRGGASRNVSQTFCLRNNVPYNIFHKWYKDTRKK